MENILEKIPQTLYKYRPYEGINVSENYGTRVLTEFELYASSPSKFNDPFDLALPYKYTRDSFTLDNFLRRYVDLYNSSGKKKKSNSELLYEGTDKYNFIINNPEKHWNDNFEAIVEMDSKFYGVLSLTAKSDDILMWSHYADHHKGFCVGIDGKRFADFLIREYNDFGFKLGPINYVVDYPEIDFMKVYEQYSIFTRCFSKQECFRYEEEYRLMFHNRTNFKIVYPKSLITDIVIGCKMSTEHVREIKQFLLKNKLENVRLSQMKMGFNKFGLETVNVTLGF